jgi:hypothetical protein
METRVKLSSLAGLSDEELRGVVARLHQAADRRPNGELERVCARIRAYEQKYDVTSETMRHEVGDGLRRETSDVCQWLLLLDLRAHLERQARAY